MDSEGLLALPALAQVQGKAHGLITGQGGRGLQPALEARGAQGRRLSVRAQRSGLQGIAGGLLVHCILNALPANLRWRFQAYALLAQMPASLLPGARHASAARQ